MPQMRNKAISLSPYEPLRGSARARHMRAQLQADFIMRQHRLLWDREVTMAADRMGVDLNTYNTLLSLQHRDITPEDYDVLQTLDSSLKPKTLPKNSLDEMLPSWEVPESADASQSADAEHAPKEDSIPDNLCVDSEQLAPEFTSLADQKCYICLDPFLGGQRARTLPCGHFFHADCIDEWLTKSSHVCPVDSRSVMEAFEKPA